MTTSGSSSSAASSVAAAAPAAGPDCARPIGTARAPATVVAPPLECVSTIGTVRPASPRRAASGSSQSNALPTYAFSSANCVRSYSRMTGASSEPKITVTPGCAAATTARTARSFDRVLERPQQRDDDRVDLLDVDQLLGRDRDRGLVDGSQHDAVAVHALGHADDVHAFDKRRRQQEPAVFADPVAPRQRHEVLEALRCD